MPLFILLFLWGLLELFVIVIVADAIGALATIGLLIAGFIGGGWLIRDQQTRWLTAMQQSNKHRNSPHAPLHDMKDGMFRMVAGMFFIMPGFITDVLALIFLISPLRRLFGREIMKLSKVDILASKFAYRSQGQVYEHDDSAVQATNEDGKVIHGTLEDSNFRDK